MCVRVYIYMCVYVCMYVCMYLYIFIYIYIIYILVKKTGNVPSRLLPICQWPHGNSCTWAHDILIYSCDRTTVHHVPKCMSSHEVIGRCVS